MFTALFSLAGALIAFALIARGMPVSLGVGVFVAEVLLGVVVDVLHRRGTISRR